MAIDPTRASFAQREFSYAVKTDATALSEQPLSRTIEVDTGCSATAADLLANELLADNSGLPRVFGFYADGVTVCDASQLASSPPVYAQTFAGFTPATGVTGRAIGVTIDYNSMVTQVVTKGQI